MKFKKEKANEILKLVTAILNKNLSENKGQVLTPQLVTGIVATSTIDLNNNLEVKTDAKPKRADIGPADATSESESGAASSNAK